MRKRITDYADCTDCRMKDEGPIQAKRLLEEIVACRQRPIMFTVVEQSRTMGKTFMVQQLLKEHGLHDQAVYPMPSENIERPTNETFKTDLPRPFYIPKPKPIKPISD